MSDDFQTSKIRKAQKEHKCYLCGTMIKKGEAYRRISGKGEYGFYDTKLHMNCDALIDKYCESNYEYEWDEDSVAEWVSDTVCSDCADDDECLFSFLERATCPVVLKRLGIGGDEKQR